MKYAVATTRGIILGDDYKKIKLELKVDTVQFLGNELILAKRENNITTLINFKRGIQTQVHGYLLNFYRKKGKVYVSTNQGCFEVDSELRINILYSKPTVGCSSNYILTYYVENDNVGYKLLRRTGEEIDDISYNRKVIFLGESRKHVYILQERSIKVCNREKGCFEKYKLLEEYIFGLIRQGRILLTDGFNIWEFKLSSRKLIHLISLDDLILSFDFIFDK